MKKLQATPLLLLAMTFGFVPGMVAADNHTDNTTVDRGDALRTARDSLSTEYNWSLDEAERDDDGYEFEFIVAGAEREAEITVDARTGAILERETESETEERDETQNSTQVATLEEARERIQELQEQVQELREDLREARSSSSESVESEEQREDLPAQADDRAREAREQGVSAEVEVEDNGSSVEFEAERRGPNQAARDNVNGTPGGDNSNRPGFVSRMLRSMFS